MTLKTWKISYNFNFQSQKPRIEIKKFPNFSFSDSRYKRDTRMGKQYKAQASMQMYDDAISLWHKWKLKIKL